MRRAKSENPSLFFNRHLSWLQFNRRVLEEALDARNPLLERVKFLAITASNLDEFVEVRRGGLLQQAEQGSGEAGPDGLAPREVLPQLSAAIHDFVDGSIRLLAREARARDGARNRSAFAAFRQLKPEARKTVERFYLERVEPLMTPVTVDPAHPFPRVLNKALCMAFLLQRRRKDSQIYLGRGHRAARSSARLPLPSRGRHHRVHFSARHRGSLCRAPLPRLQDSLRPRRSASRATAISTCAKKNRAASWIRLTRSSIAAAKARPCGWKSRPAPIPEIIERLRSNFRLARLADISGATGPSISRASSISTIRRRARI